MATQTRLTDDYQGFLDSKSQLDSMHGFEPIWMPDFLKDFQKYLVDWVIRKGRGAIFSACGTGKTPCQLVWAENVVRYTNKPVLILTPLAVAGQTVREADKFGIEAVRSRGGIVPDGARIIVTNYDQLHKYDPSKFSGCVCDESGAIKHFDSKRTSEVIEFMRMLPYRLLATATPAPNDFDELGTSAEALGEMGYQDMITKFFRKVFVSDYKGWNRNKFQLKGHADRDFWRWVCSWARACQKPSDLGFDDSEFILPPLETQEHTVVARTTREGFLFDVPAITLREQREERRRSIAERCEQVVSLVGNTGQQAIAWGHLNDECNLMTRMIKGAVQVAGSDHDDAKEERLLAFAAGQIRVLVSKPIICAWGLNLQNCSHQTFFVSHSYEQFFQAVRRSWRFGQTRPVHIDMISSEGEKGVIENLKRKAEAAELMFDQLVSLMHDPLKIRRGGDFTKEAKLPAWLGIPVGNGNGVRNENGIEHDHSEIQGD